MEYLIVFETVTCHVVSVHKGPCVRTLQGPLAPRAALADSQQESGDIRPIP
jgi:hypothetical protein